MGHPKVAVALALLPLALGCASVRWSVQKALRSEGRVNQAFPEAVWNQYDCDAKALPFFVIETNELVPPVVKAGGEFNHRMLYAMCPPRPTEVVTGRLTTRILFRGAPIFDQAGPYEIQPGRWRVDAFVELPEDAEPGVYAYAMRFESAGLSFDEVLTFLVNGP